ncbi:ethanolamine ammonia-lyase reactivating factor EutA [Neobacillus sp. NPDC093127]|uniref:ethanolamine ammonia-lyase reactivating factor EutA n=1 Tax=Neobacillus sp. NPDC093127 TaxID=3364296 RepID=UPI0038271A4F
MSTVVIKSVGIDIGTSTSKFMMSELTLGRVSSHFSLPQFDIIERKITYVSEIISTPLKNEEEIDLPPLVSWLEKEYQQVGLTLSDIKSGAVIITGETAIKKNADALIHYLAERSGDFVVAIAGASLEAVLAGKGSGAARHSQSSRAAIANIDIGGGTANVVVFQQGKVLETITFHIGGRLIEINSLGEVLTVSPSLKPWLFLKKFQVEKGMRLSLPKLVEITSALCADLLDVLSGGKSISSLESLIHSTSCQALPRIHEVMVSGGVGRLALEEPPATLEDVAKFNDIGPLLASELMKAVERYHFSVVEAGQTSSATVIGAGTQTTRLSGATISIQPELLPLRNIPVVKAALTEMDFELEIEQAFLKGKEWFGGNDRLPIAIGLGGTLYLSYLKLKEFAGMIGNLYSKHFPRAEVLAVVCENDMAKALGQALRLQTKYQVICIDQIGIEHGDYIDIGAPLNDELVPVVVKTLAFS